MLILGSHYFAEFSAFAECSAKMEEVFGEFHFPTDNVEGGEMQ